MRLHGAASGETARNILLVVALRAGDSAACDEENSFGSTRFLG